MMASHRSREQHDGILAQSDSPRPAFGPWQEEQTLGQADMGALQESHVRLPEDRQQGQLGHVGEGVSEALAKVREDALVLLIRQHSDPGQILRREDGRGDFEVDQGLLEHGAEFTEFSDHGIRHAGDGATVSVRLQRGHGDAAEREPGALGPVLAEKAADAFGHLAGFAPGFEIQDPMAEPIVQGGGCGLSRQRGSVFGRHTSTAPLDPQRDRLGEPLIGPREELGAAMAARSPLEPIPSLSTGQPNAKDP
jgi:hypothetical protein